MCQSQLHLNEMTCTGCCIHRRQGPTISEKIEPHNIDIAKYLATISEISIHPTIVLLCTSITL